MISGRSEEMPEGDAFLVWKNLVAKFEPVTIANLIKMQQEFGESKLGVHNDF